MGAVQGFWLCRCFYLCFWSIIPTHFSMPVPNSQQIDTENSFYRTEVYPPISYDHFDGDIPREKIYGPHEPCPSLIADAAVSGAAGAGTADPATVTSPPTVDKLATDWLESFNSVLKEITDTGSTSKMQSLFTDHAVWRDHLALSWDLHSFNGLSSLESTVVPKIHAAGLHNFKIDKLADYRYNSGIGKIVYHQATGANPIPIEWVQVYYDFENKNGKGKGVARLVAVNDPQPTLKCFTIYTALEDLHCSPEAINRNRPEGVNHGQHLHRESWLERRSREQDFQGSHQPTVLIVGGGQGGLTVAARLKCFGVDSLIVEKNPRVGDNWRNRYKFLVLHDPIWYDHLPYLNFPPTWPIYTPKDKLGDWFDAYAKTLDLNVKTNSTVAGADFDSEKNEWTVTVTDNKTGETIKYKPHHLVMATGHSGEARVPRFQDQEVFKGKIVHSSRHTSGADFTGGKALVVGGCNSAHDICQDFYEQGVDVTMLQRSSTCVITSEHGTTNNIAGLYDESGPKTETADHIFHSMPIGLLNAVMQQQYRKSCIQDKHLLDALAKVGFKTNAGYNSTGLFGLYFRQGSGYYIDVGCSKLIADGKVKVKQGQGIKKFLPNGVEFTDGTKLEGLDVVVLATGFTNMRDTARRLFGTKVSDKLKEVWGLDHEGEFKTIWRDSGHPNFWYMGGNLAISRYYSKRLALKIIAKEKGLEY